jgi:hypothetical protein
MRPQGLKPSPLLLGQVIYDWFMTLRKDKDLQTDQTRIQLLNFLRHPGYGQMPPVLLSAASQQGKKLHFVSKIRG